MLVGGGCVLVEGGRVGLGEGDCVLGSLIEPVRKSPPVLGDLW